VNIRSGPGTEFEPVGFLLLDDVVPVIESSSDGSWHKVRLEDGTEGWVGSTLVELIQLTESDSVSQISQSNLDLQSVPDYRVEDISFLDVPRYSLFTTVPSPISVEEVKAVCTLILEDFKQQHSFNAITIFVSDTDVPINGYTIARCDYAPNGVWSDADTVETGDYSTHRFTYALQPKLNDLNAAASERPSDEEFTICANWSETDLELFDPAADVYEHEERVLEIVGERHNLSADELRVIVNKCIFWTFR
jgi:hypothetical protein